MIRRTLLATAVLLIAANATAQGALKEAMEARAAGDYARAIAILRSAHASGEGLQTDLLLAETLAWNKQFDESAAQYGEIRRAHPELRDATLGLGRVRLWQARYGEAERLFSELLDRNGSDADAREGMATAAYWSGDFRTAERDFAGLRSDFARRSLAEIRAGSRPGMQVDVDSTRDDQPFRSLRTAVRGTYFTDPLTRWDGWIGAHQVTSTAGGSHRLPFVTIGNETVFPAARLTVTASIGGIRTPDDRMHATGGASARLRLGRHSTLALSFAEREIVTNATRLFPFVRASSLRWQLDGARLASIGAERLRFSDRNTGLAADGYVLLPIFRRGRLTLRAGASALYRDTRDARFYVTGISSTLISATGLYRYTYRGAYDPYWTPDNLIEARGIAALEMSVGPAVVRLQGDGGRARDDALAFRPEAGPTPFPSATGVTTFRRSFDPRRIRLTIDSPVVHDLHLNVGYEHSVTAYYEANTFHATVGRRR